MVLCGYSCGREAKFPPRKGMTKWCCESDWKLCSKISTGKSIKMKKVWSDPNSKLRSEEFLDSCRKGIQNSWDRDSKRKEELGKRTRELWEDKNSFFNIIETRNKIGNNTKKYWEDKNSRFNSGEFRSLLSSKIRISLNKLQEKYPGSFTCEEIRENIEGHIELRCKNCRIWFLPSQSQLWERIRALKSNGGSFRCFYWYCSERCKLKVRTEEMLREERYCYLVMEETYKTIRNFSNKIENLELRGEKFGYDLDHKYSKYEGFVNNVDPTVVGHWKNLEIIPAETNRYVKNRQSSITLEQLIQEIHELKDKSLI